MRPDTKKSCSKKKKPKKIKKNNKKMISRIICLNRLMKKIVKKLKINKSITLRLKFGKKTMKNSKNLRPEKLHKNSKSWNSTLTRSLNNSNKMNKIKNKAPPKWVKMKLYLINTLLKNLKNLKISETSLIRKSWYFFKKKIIFF